MPKRKSIFCDIWILAYLLFLTKLFQIQNCESPNSFSMSKTTTITQLTSDSAREILNKTLEELQTTEITQKLDEARDNVGNEMLKMMQYLFPVVMQVQMDVIKDFGFPEGREGIIKFSQSLRILEREDAEVARLHGLIKAYYLPSVSVHAANESPADEITSSS